MSHKLGAVCINLTRRSIPYLYFSLCVCVLFSNNHLLVFWVGSYIPVGSSHGMYLYKCTCVFAFLFVYVCLSVAEVYILLSLKVEAGRATVTVDDISRSSPRSFSTRALKTNPIWGTMWTIYGKDKGGIYMKYPPLRYGSGAHKAGWATLSHKIPLFSISTVCTPRAKTTKE